MRTTRTETLGLTAGLILLIGGILSGCATTPGSTATSDSKGNEVNRSDPEATAVAFATLYAAGNGPGACQMVTQELRDRLDTKCDGQQPWNTAVTQRETCDTAKGRYFQFEAAVGSLDRFDGLDLWVREDPTTKTWTVTAAGPYSRDQQYDFCGEASRASSPATQTSG